MLNLIIQILIIVQNYFSLKTEFSEGENGRRKLRIYLEHFLPVKSNFEYGYLCVSILSIGQCKGVNCPINRFYYTVKIARNTKEQQEGYFGNS